MRRPFLWILGVLLGLALPAFAHNPDTSYARIQISSNQLAIRLTYDLFTILKVTPVDENNDRRISQAELEKQTGRLASFLNQYVLLDINEREANLGKLSGFVWPPGAAAIPEDDYHSAAGLIHFDFIQPLEDTPEDVTITFDFFPQFGERHTILGVFEHEGQPYEVIFTRFEPDFVYDTGYQPPMRKRLWKFLKLGVAHIFLGYDHILFLLALVVVSRFFETVKIVTSFTVAHTITLALATLEIVSVPTRLIEAGIALTIIYVAAENLWTRKTAHRWVLTFFFGLIHGFGFANVLRDLGLPGQGLARCLVSFNVGVELGQLVIVAAFWPVAFALGKWKHGERTKRGISVAILLFGVAWFVERAFRLQFMPI